MLLVQLSMEVTARDGITVLDSRVMNGNWMGLRPGGQTRSLDVRVFACCLRPSSNTADVVAEAVVADARESSHSAIRRPVLRTPYTPNRTAGLDGRTNLQVNC